MMMTIMAIFIILLMLSLVHSFSRSDLILLLFVVFSVAAVDDVKIQTIVEIQKIISDLEVKTERQASAERTDREPRSPHHQTVGGVLATMKSQHQISDSAGVTDIVWFY